MPTGHLRVYCFQKWGRLFSEESVDFCKESSPKIYTKVASWHWCSFLQSYVHFMSLPSTSCYLLHFMLRHWILNIFLGKCSYLLDMDGLYTLFKQKERMWWQTMCHIWCHMKYKGKITESCNHSQRKRAKNEAQTSYTRKMSQWNYNLDSFTSASTFAQTISFHPSGAAFTSGLQAIEGAAVTLKGRKVDLSQRRHMHCPCPPTNPIPLWQWVIEQLHDKDKGELQCFE